MPKNHKWLYSYETYSFDTVDGNLHIDEYALPEDSAGGFLIHDSNNIESFLRVPTLDTTGMTKVNRASNRAFDVFEDPDTKVAERYVSDLTTYRALAVKDAGPRTKITL